MGAAGPNGRSGQRCRGYARSNGDEMARPIAARAKAAGQKPGTSILVGLVAHLQGAFLFFLRSPSTRWLRSNTLFFARRNHPSTPECSSGVRVRFRVARERAAVPVGRRVRLAKRAFCPSAAARSVWGTRAGAFGSAAVNALSDSGGPASPAASFPSLFSAATAKLAAPVRPAAGMVCTVVFGSGWGVRNCAIKKDSPPPKISPHATRKNVLAMRPVRQPVRQPVGCRPVGDRATVSLALGPKAPELAGVCASIDVSVTKRHPLLLV